MRIDRNNIYFVLVEPRTPGNVGASARALKTMGFSNLLLVNPHDHLNAEARWMGHASEDLLEAAVVYDNFAEAIADMHFVVATTQRERVFHLPYYTPRELSRKITPISLKHKIAIVFGREKTGLTNEELAMCDAVSTVPAATKHPSLNLSQAVMLYAAELFQAAYEDISKYNWRLATHHDLEMLYRHLRTGLEKVNFEPIDNWDNFMMRFSRLFGRANAEVRDVRVWHKIIKSFEQHISQLEQKAASNAEELFSQKEAKDAE